MWGTKLTRTFKEGWTSFYRDGWLTFATVTIMALALYVLSVTVTLGLSTYFALQDIQDRVNISVYFNLDVSETEMIDIKKTLESAAEIQSVEYISRSQAIENFRASVENDPLITQTLDELEKETGNPLPASLVIRAYRSEDYESIAARVEEFAFRDKILDVNFNENRAIIDRVGIIIGFIQKVGFGIALIFVVIAILITFNTVRMSMYTRRREFEIMRLVGASNLYVKMPIIFEGIFYGITGSLIAIILLFLTAAGVQQMTTGLFESGNSLSLYYRYFAMILGALLIFGAALGMFSSFIAIRRYLEK